MTTADVIFKLAIAEAEAFKESAEGAGLTPQEALEVAYLLYR
jgi:hypothetical protein